MVSESVWPRKKAQICEFSDINEVLHEWYLLACSKNTYPVGLQLCEEAKQIAEPLQSQNSRHLMAGSILTMV